jgi:hypothetical protein
MAAFDVNRDAFLPTPLFVLVFDPKCQPPLGRL